MSINGAKNAAIFIAEIFALSDKDIKEKLIKYREKMVSDVRGMGFMWGMELKGEAAPIIKKCIDAGLLLVGAGPNVIRFVPPLIASKEDIDEMAKILDKALE